MTDLFMEIGTDYVIPPFTKPLHHQIAGHKHGKGGTKLGMLKHNDGSVLKPLSSDIRGERESSFYQLISDTSKDDAIVKELATFLPNYWGTWTTHFNNLSVKYLRLEDIADHFSHPCNLDIKIGAVTYDPDASVQKRKYEEEKFPEAELIGFRISGMRIFDEHSHKYISFSRDFGKSYTAETIVDGLHVYLNNENTCIALFILSRFIHRLKDIESWFTRQRKFAFYSSSLLFFYEGKTVLWLSTLQEWIQLNSLKESVSDEVFSKKQPNTSQDDSLLPNSDSPGFLKNHLHNLLAKNIVFLEQKVVCPVCKLNSVVCTRMQSASSLVDVCMVDFAHVYNAECEDANYLFGLRNLIRIFQKLQEKILNNCKMLYTGKEL